MSLSPPPPSSITRDDYSAADSARKKLTPKSHFPHFLSLPNLRGSKQVVLTPESPADYEAQVHPPAGDSDFIHLDPSGLESEEEHKDKYEWAIIYENQRGITLFSIPYYSPLSLLPSDPSPFTIPNTSLKRSKQPPVSLTDYSLPDGTWRWVSKCWMIDMRSDSGEVQHDGFEYNWMFRTHNWRANVGSFNAGGWVRRRRWIRLMMRPAKERQKCKTDGLSRSAPGSFSDLPARYRHSATTSYVPSVTPLDTSELSSIVDDLWSSDDVEVNWTKCHMLMRHLGRDGRKIELWKTWLAHYHQHLHTYESSKRNVKGKPKQWTEDDMPMPSELESEMSLSDDFIVKVRTPPREYLIPLLRKYGDSLLHLFIFPDSRAELLELLGHAGLLPELNISLGIGKGASEVEFWSYASELAHVTG